MVAPTVSALSPAQGLSQGETLVEITGTNFITPTPRLNADPATGGFVRVFFDNVEALEVGVVSATKLFALTPRTALANPAAVDVRVENVTIIGTVVEPVTVTGGFTYQRPALQTKRDHTTDSAILIVTRQIVIDLRQYVLAATFHNMHPEYVDSVSATAAEEVQATAPNLKILGPNVQEDREYAEGESPFNQQTTPIPGTFNVITAPTVVRLTYDYIGLGRSTGEAYNLWSALTEYFKRTPDLNVPQDGVSKANGIVRLDWNIVWEERADFRSQATREAVYQFSGSFVVRGVRVGGIKIREGVDTTKVPIVVAQPIPQVLP